MTASAIPAQNIPAPRIQSVDALRGAIMMLMAIDHIRDYVARSAQQFLPTDLTRTTPTIFLTRWITVFCAPVFVLTAGLGAYSWMTRGRHSKGDLSRLLISRGIWLIVLEVTILRLIFFSQISFGSSPVILIILWAIGVSMIVLAG
jgi:uncharacterized membrane protein